MPDATLRHATAERLRRMVDRGCVWPDERGDIKLVVDTIDDEETARVKQRIADKLAALRRGRSFEGITIYLDTIFKCTSLVLPR